MGGNYTEAQKRATDKYLKSMKNISIRVKPADYEEITTAAAAANMSLRAFVLEAIHEKIERQETEKTTD